jgi:MoxR-like ATPase
VATVTTGMLPEAEFVFLDELFNANSAILNNLLTVLNERIFRRGAETHRLPVLSLFSASNHLPEDDALKALFDRFLLRCHVENLKREAMPQLLTAGWALERGTPLQAAVTAGDLADLGRQVHAVDLASVQEAYADTVFKVRDLGIAFSDRRAVKVLKLLAASALLCGRTRATPADLWVLRYVWDREEQIDPLAALVNGILKQHQDEPDAHPLAAAPERVDGEDLARELEAVAQELQAGGGSLTTLARLRERLAGLADRAAWVGDAQARQHLLQRTNELLKKVG